MTGSHCITVFSFIMQKQWGPAHCRCESRCSASIWRINTTFRRMWPPELPDVYLTVVPRHWLTRSIIDLTFLIHCLDFIDWPGLTGVHANTAKTVAKPRPGQESHPLCIVRQLSSMEWLMKQHTWSLRTGVTSFNNKIPQTQCLDPQQSWRMRLLSYCPPWAEW